MPEKFLITAVLVLAWGLGVAVGVLHNQKSPPEPSVLSCILLSEDGVTVTVNGPVRSPSVSSSGIVQDADGFVYVLRAGELCFIRPQSEATQP